MLILISTNILDMVLDFFFYSVDNKKKDISILGEGPTQRLDDTTLTAGKNNSINLLSLERNFV